jgi:hypothetical protein
VVLRSVNAAIEQRTLMTRNIINCLIKLLSNSDKKDSKTCEHDIQQDIHKTKSTNSPSGMPELVLLVIIVMLLVKLAVVLFGKSN